MKKLVALVVLGLVLTSCKKNSSGSVPISVTINDTFFSFSQAAQGTMYNNGKEIQVSCANNTNALKAIQFYIELRSNTAITPGIYSDTANTGSALPTIYRYTNVRMSPYLESVSAPINGSFYSIGLPSNPFTVTVTSISATSIQGTFSGKLYLDEDSTATADSIKVITSGKLSAPIIVVN